MTELVPAISLWQPWATLVARGLKCVETRSWPTDYRGPLLIHAAKTIPGAHAIGRWVWEELELHGLGQCEVRALPRGAVIAVAELIGCEQMTPALIARQTNRELAFGDWRLFRYAWYFGKVEALAEPVSMRGRQKLWRVEWPTSELVS